MKRDDLMNGTLLVLIFAMTAAYAAVVLHIGIEGGAPIAEARAGSAAVASTAAESADATRHTQWTGDTQ